MTTRLTCPRCGFSADAEAYLAEERWRAAVGAALKLPAPLGDALVRYIGLFRPAKRALSPDRAARLLTELLDPIASARIERDGRTWVAPLAIWSEALETMLASRDRLVLPLKSHGYLHEIVVSLANKAEGRVETQREQTRAYAFATERQGAGAPVPVARFKPAPEQRAALRDALKRPADGDTP